MEHVFNEHFMPFSRLPVPLMRIAEKVIAGERINPEEGILLYEKGELGFLAMLAEQVRFRLNSDDVFFIRNFHIEPTNICVNKCRFCSYSHHFSPRKWDLTVEEMLATVVSQDRNVKEVHITGAVHPEKDIYYYEKLFRKIKSVRPDLHIKALSAVELEYILNKAKVSVEQGLKFLQAAGLDSIPGGGAEIFDEKIRQEICASKTSAEKWLEIHETAHRLGITSNATMLYGHIENYGHRISHMSLLRDSQDRFGRFNAFIPLKFRNSNNELSGVHETSVVEDMKNYAVARIFLDNFPHLKGYWPMIGKPLAQLSLSFGVDDMDGTINDTTSIYSLAGASEQNPRMTVSEMRELIVQAKRNPVERDSLYQLINSSAH
ncbi:MAG: CofH family radical SAM protein [Bacteroidetes bacterium]|nr:CofH family radical SAM protein [Bacteroidota bacterium]